MNNIIEVRVLGAVDYKSAMDIQYREKQNVLENKSNGVILMLEHNPPVITMGRHCAKSNITAAESLLLKRGYHVVSTDRGGDVTVHEPGQLVVYYILPVKSKNSSAFVAGIIDPVLETLNYYLAADLYYSDKKPGLWHGNEKCVSIGFDLRLGVSMHGIAINVCNTLEGFSFINPCGIPGAMMTTLSRIMGKDISVSEVMEMMFALYGPPAPPYQMHGMNS